MRWPRSSYGQPVSRLRDERRPRVFGPSTSQHILTPQLTSRPSCGVRNLVTKTSPSIPTGCGRRDLRPMGQEQMTSLDLISPCLSASNRHMPVNAHASSPVAAQAFICQACCARAGLSRRRAEMRPSTRPCPDERRRWRPLGRSLPQAVVILTLYRGTVGVPASGAAARSGRRARR